MYQMLAFESPGCDSKQNSFLLIRIISNTSYQPHLTECRGGGGGSLQIFFLIGVNKLCICLSFLWCKYYLYNNKC